MTLEMVSRQFGDVVDLHPRSSGSLPLPERIGRDVHKTPHRCAGYKREEITLTSSISGSAIFLHAFPTPQEICKVCGLVVKEREHFRCECGLEGGSGL